MDDDNIILVEQENQTYTRLLMRKIECLMNGEPVEMSEFDGFHDFHNEQGYVPPPQWYTECFPGIFFVAFALFTALMGPSYSRLSATLFMTISVLIVMRNS